VLPVERRFLAADRHKSSDASAGATVSTSTSAVGRGMPYNAVMTKPPKQCSVTGSVKSASRSSRNARHG
jgi:hypothetical protein